MRDQIAIFDQPTLGPAVSGRQLQGLISTSNAQRDSFSGWFADRISKLELQDGIDYLRSTTTLTGHTRQFIEYIVSVPAAIRIAQYQSGKRGMPLANYLTTYLQNPQVEQSAEALAVTSAPFPELKSTIAEGNEKNSPEAAIDEPGKDDALPATSGESTPPAPSEPAKLKTAAELLLEQAMRLVADEQKQAQEPRTAPIDAELFNVRLTALESKVGALLSIFQQAGTLAASSPQEAKETDPTAPPTVRTLLCRLVNNYAAATQKSEHDTWRYLYGHYALRTGVDVYAQVPGKRGDQSYLAAIEAADQIGDLYVLAKKLFVLPSLK